MLKTNWEERNGIFQQLNIEYLENMSSMQQQQQHILDRRYLTSLQKKPQIIEMYFLLH